MVWTPLSMRIRQSSGTLTVVPDVTASNRETLRTLKALKIPMYIEPLSIPPVASANETQKQRIDRKSILFQL